MIIVNMFIRLRFTIELTMKKHICCKNKSVQSSKSFPFLYNARLDRLYILSKKRSAQVGVRVNPVLARNSGIKCYISLFTEIILQQFGAFKIEIQASLTKL